MSRSVHKAGGAVERAGQIIEELRSTDYGITVMIFATEYGYRVEGIDIDTGEIFGVWKYTGESSYYAALHRAASCVW